MICKGQDRCLFVFPIAEFGRVTEAAAHRAGHRPAGARLRPRAVRQRVERDPDGQGRITVPPPLRHYAGLTKDCVVIGANTRIEVWDAVGVAGLPRAAPSRRSPSSPRRCCRALYLLTSPSIALTRDWPTSDPASSRPPPGAPSPVPGGTAGTRRAGTQISTSATPHLPHPTGPNTPSRTESRPQAARRPQTRRLEQSRTPPDRPTGEPGTARVRPCTSRSCSSGCSACSPRRSPTSRPSPSTPPSASAATPRRCSRPTRSSRWSASTATQPRSRAAGTGWPASPARVHLVHAVYDRMPDVLEELGLYDGVDGVLFDLGVSSMQLDVAERGFAYAQDAPLDMRMDQDRGITAAEVVNEYSVADARAGAARVRRGAVRAADRAGHRPRAPRWRRCSRRPSWPNWSASAIPAATRRHGGHPAKRTFQALRIEVNGELDALRAAIPAALDALRTAGGSWCCPTTRSRTGSSSKPSPRWPTTRPRRTCRCPLPEQGPQLRLLTRGGAGQRGRDRRQPARRVGAAASRRTHPDPGMTRAGNATRRAAPGRADPRPHRTRRAPSGHRGKPARRRPAASRRTRPTLSAAPPSHRPVAPRRTPFALLVTGLVVGGLCAAARAEYRLGRQRAAPPRLLDSRTPAWPQPFSRCRTTWRPARRRATWPRPPRSSAWLPAGNPALLTVAPRRHGPRARQPRPGDLPRHPLRRRRRSPRRSQPTSPPRRARPSAKTTPTGKPTAPPTSTAPLPGRRPVNPPRDGRPPTPAHERRVRRGRPAPGGPALRCAPRVRPARARRGRHRARRRHPGRPPRPPDGDTPVGRPTSPDASLDGSAPAVGADASAGAVCAIRIPSGCRAAHPPTGRRETAGPPSALTGPDEHPALHRLRRGRARCCSSSAAGSSSCRASTVQLFAAAAAAQRVDTVDLHALRGQILDRNGNGARVHLRRAGHHRRPVSRCRRWTGSATRCSWPRWSGAARRRRTGAVAPRQVRRSSPARSRRWPRRRSASWASRASTRRPTTQRQYPGHTTAANLVGTVHSDGTGAAGIESSINDVLAGQDGSVTYASDAVGNMNPSRPNHASSPQNGGTVS